MNTANNAFIRVSPLSNYSVLISAAQVRRVAPCHAREQAVNIEVRRVSLAVQLHGFIFGGLFYEE